MKKLFFNGNILTMDENGSVQAMIIEEGRILYTGTNEEMLLNDIDETIDLKGKTVLPGFIDAHSHLSSYANSFLQASLSEAKSFDDIIETLKKFADVNHLGVNDWMIANGYDHNILREKTHPTAQMLDRYFNGMKIVLQHQSGHFGVFSSSALQAIGFSGRDKNGYLEENDYVEAIKQLPMPSLDKLIDAYKRALKGYASYGITTIQEGMMVRQMLPLYQMLLKGDVLNLDVVGYPQIADAEEFYRTFSDYQSGYKNRFRLGGYKIILDGSPQGRTAWMKTPYIGSVDDFGVSNMRDEEVVTALKKAVDDNRQILVHCNGDAAAEQLLLCAEELNNPSALASIRPVIIHAQLLDLNQLSRVKKYGFILSFFVAHCYYWGDTHITNFGLERASKISPSRSALDNAICITFHQDTPVVEPNMLHTIWCAVNRITKNGVTLGACETISPFEAIKAITINAAYQYHEENEKGTLTAGKTADFVILDNDPLKVPPEEIKNIKVLETYKDGECVFSA